MSKLLFHLRGVPEDEAEAVRKLLIEQHIDFYETPASKWGFSSGALWLNDIEQNKKARTLLEEFQQQRTHNSRVAYERASRDGSRDSFLRKLRREPGRFILYLIGLLFVLYITIAPFLGLLG